MVRPAARKKAKNPHRVVSRRTKNPLNVSFAGAHPLVKAHWDKSLTLRQNYERMGLMSALNGKAGGIYGKPTPATTSSASASASAETSMASKKIKMASLGEMDTLFDLETLEASDDVTEASIPIEYRSFEDFEKMPTVTGVSQSSSDLNTDMVDWDSEEDSDEDAYGVDGDGNDEVMAEQEDAGLEGPISVDPRAKLIGVKLGSKAAAVLASTKSSSSSNTSKKSPSASLSSSACLTESTAATDSTDSALPILAPSESTSNSNTLTAHSTRKRIAPLPVNVVQAMQEQAALGELIQFRHVSEQEAKVFNALIAKHGEGNFGAMARDIKLNKYQLTPGQLRRKMSRKLKI